MDCGYSTEQGQCPNEEVVLVEQQQDLGNPYLNGRDMPVTVVGIELVLCPLMRLRDCGEAGEHYTDVHIKIYRDDDGIREIFIPGHISAQGGGNTPSSGYKKQRTPQRTGSALLFLVRGISPAHPVYGWPW